MLETPPEPIELGSAVLGAADAAVDVFGGRSAPRIVCRRRPTEFHLNESAQNRKFGQNRIIADHSQRLWRAGTSHSIFLGEIGGAARI